MPATTSSTISEQIKQIPVKKEALKKSLETLQSISSSLIDLNIQWKDIEDHFSPIESSIYERFNSLPQTACNVKTETELCPMLKSFCTNMDPVGLRNYVAANQPTTEDVALALKFAINPAVLVLDAIHGYYPAQISKKVVESLPWKICVKMLESLYMLWDDVKDKVGLVKDKAMALAVEWKGKLTDDNNSHTMGFLLLIVIYGLVSEFKMDELLNYFVNVGKMRVGVSLVKPLGLEDKCQVIIQKQCSLGRQLEALPIVFAFNLVDKFPPVPLIKAFLAEARNKSLETQKSESNSSNPVKKGTAEEIHALSLALTAIEEFNLEKEFPIAEILKRISQLEKEEATRKKAATPATASSLKSAPQQRSSRSSRKRSAEWKTHQLEKEEAARKKAATPATASSSKSAPQQRSSRKRSAEWKTHQPQPQRRQPSAPPPVIGTNPYYNSLLIQAQAGLDDRALASHVPGPGPYAPIYSPIRGLDISRFSGVQLSGLGGGRASPPPPRPFYYSVESLAGNSALQQLALERAMVHRGFDGLPDHLPPSYGSTLYR